MEEIEQQQIEEGKIKPIKKETIVGITPSFKESILSYLETRPHKEVELLIQGLRACHPFEVQFNG